MRSIYAPGAPPMLRVAAAAQALEALGLFAAAVAQAAEVASGKSYHASNGIALTVLEVITVALMAWIASAVARLRPWGRTPAIMTQICVALLAIIFLQSHRPDWGVPALVLALAGLGGLFSPASLRALARPRPQPENPPAQAPPSKAPAAKAASGKAAPARTSASGAPTRKAPPGKPQPARKDLAGPKRK